MQSPIIEAAFLFIYRSPTHLWQGFAAQRKIPVVLYPVHQNPRFHGQKSILILSVHKNRCFHGQNYEMKAPIHK